MTEPGARRYTDAHVRADWQRYVELTSEYLRHYEGEFELLVSYKLRLEAGVRLSVPMIRATLNCMRFDASVVSMPEPQVLADVVDLTTRRARRLTFASDAPAPARPRRIPLATMWRKAFGIS